jgi:predicted DNA-binding transcriptional regulator AlpA
MKGEYLRAPDVAALCGVSERSVREWTRRYLIPHRRLGSANVVLYPAWEIRAWIEDPTRPCDVKRGSDGSRVVRQLAA